MTHRADRRQRDEDWWCRCGMTINPPDMDTCPHCGGPRDAPPVPPRLRRRQAVTLNAGSLLLIPVAMLMDEFSVMIYVVGVLVNGVAAVLWIISGVRGPGPRVLRAGFGVVLSWFVGTMFLVATVWSAV